MSLVNAVHALLEVAAGRRNLSAAEADQLHDEIDAPAVTPAPVPSEPDPTTPGVSGSGTSAGTEGVNLDAPADA